MDLPKTAVPAGRDVLTLDGVRPAYGSLSLDLEIRGPERVGAHGPQRDGQDDAAARHHG